MAVLLQRDGLRSQLMPKTEGYDTDVWSGWLVDTHAHLYPAFRASRFLGAAEANFRNAARRLGLPAPAVGCLLLMETPETLTLGDLEAWATEAEGWSLEPTAEAESLLVRRMGVPSLVLIRGRQVRTAEGLEVLALGGGEAEGEGVGSGAPLALILEALEEDWPVIVPWGFGKWFGSRGRLVDAHLEASGAALCVGENGNWPRHLPVPRGIQRARERGMRILQGSDPLPLPWHARRAGQCGIYLPARPDLERPLEQLRPRLATRGKGGQGYCKPEPLWRFLVAQAIMQVRSVGRGRDGSR